LQNHPREDVHFLRGIFATLGPFARECYDTRTEEDLEYKVEDIKKICHRYDPKTILKLPYNVDSLEAIHPTVLMRSEGDDECRRWYTHEFGSAAIARIYCEIWRVGWNGETKIKSLAFNDSSQEKCLEFILTT